MPVRFKGDIETGRSGARGISTGRKRALFQKRLAKVRGMIV